MKNIFDKIITKFNTYEARMCKLDICQHQLPQQKCKVMKE